ncbi:hypothetical protein [uncultured Amnibacterium sp.]|uniref:hypothetical protein n=1 Tax=uncultured Amnibacterium sp. TaxID=1631851 RepID=UPI0035CB221D
MHIDYFREHQNDVFIPALAFVLVAAIVIALPILFGPTLARRGRRRPVLTLCVAVAAIALVGAALASLPGFATLNAQRQTLQSELRDRYGIDVPIRDAGKLLNGDTFVLPATHLKQKVHLQSTGGGDYILVHAPVSAGNALELPRT